LIQQIDSTESNEKIEKLVRERVAEELKRAREQQEQVNQSAYGELSKKNIENDHNSVAMKEDIESLIQKLQR
jgi:predicted nucleotidyltransferase